MEWIITVNGSAGEEGKVITTDDFKDVGDMVIRELHKDPWARIEIEPYQGEGNADPSPDPSFLG